jgi:hypothetical protein
MYGKLGTSAGVVGGGMLPVTGPQVAGLVIGGIVLVFAALALFKVLPKLRRR